MTGSTPDIPVLPLSAAVESVSEDRGRAEDLARQMSRVFDSMSIAELQKLKVYLAKKQVLPERPKATDVVRVLACLGMQYSMAIRRGDKARQPPRKEVED